VSYQVRRGTFDDIEDILVMLQEFAVFYNSRYSVYPDEEHAKKFLTSMVNDHLVLVCTHDGETIGLIAGMLLPHIFNPKIKTLVETFWWVQKDYRETRAGAMLLNEYVRFGRQNVNWILATIEDNSPVRDETFLKRGFKLKEKSFLMEV
jgi:hypothetical protein